MEVFPLELQLFIAKKIVASSTRGLLSFRAFVTLHLQLSKDVDVLRVVSADCLHLLTIPSPNAGQRKFMQQLTLSGLGNKYLYSPIVKGLGNGKNKL